MFFLNDITSVCADSALARPITLFHTIFNIICIIVPIVLIISASLSVVSLMMNPDKKNGLKTLVFKFISAIVIFFVPSALNIIMNWVEIGTSDTSSLIFNISTCWNEAEATNQELSDATYKNMAGTEVKGSLLSSLMGDLSGLKNYTSGSSVAGTETLEGGMPMPIYYQQDYADVVLQGDRTISSSGCGFTSGAMVASYLTGTKITPRELISGWSRAYYVYGSGMSWGFPAALAAHYNLGSVRETNSISEVVKALQNNQPVMSSQSAGLFTGGGHIIALRGATSDGKILVNDPNKNNAINKGFNNRQFTQGEVNASARKYWIFEAKK